ncbi:MalY/PatB family protein [Alicyclobacillus mengziensis]|uniref:cysteine-S-conjugate beta-lyase n=1 Tax=Alicyclobacillus mengziensis TaxID=2931921 RepID=A0A9X7VZF8_9BACL|nr:MalY/PatB family protein [Alicyclobacillus mengziensis]QSO47891.1 pyridoxal phosphate-dependent aminotransferase [Alicyclobacillus mengziensis]
MPHDFDREVTRKGTDSTKWGSLDTLFGNSEAIPMWVADMDFESPKPVVEALTKRAEHGVYGYGRREPDYFQPVSNWLKKRHGWDVPIEIMFHSPGVLTGLSYLITLLTEQGDGVLIQPPVYHPFAHIVENLKRNLITNPLRQRADGTYAMDLSNLRQEAKRAKVMILCSPHNPVSRVWNRDELQELWDICAEHGLFVISDEIHSDLIMPGFHHTPFASLSESTAKQSATFIAPSKTFNLAGLQSAIAIIPDEALRERFKHVLQTYHLSSPNIFGSLALQTAYEEGEDWLDELLPYLAANAQFAQSYLAEHAPEIKAAPLEGTYLMWLDCRALGLSDDELAEFMNRTAGVAMNQGHTFGAGGGGFLRMNIACPRAQLAQALERVAKAVQARR